MTKPIGRPRVAAYCRVSTDMQVNEGHSLQTQERLCREYCDNEWGVGNYAFTTYVEEGKSGALQVRQYARSGDKVRPVLSDLVDHIADGRFTHVVIYEVSRMSREDYLWKMIRHDALKPNDVSLRVVAGNLDLDDEDDAFMADLLSLVSARERSHIRRRILDSHESRRKAGYWPNGHPPWGWRWQEEHEVEPGERKTIVPDLDRAMWVLFMVDKLLRHGWGCRRIAAEMQKTGVLSGRKEARWTTTPVYRILINPGHAGYVTQKDGTLLKGKHYTYRLFDLETHQRILATLAGRNIEKTRSYDSDDFPLTGIIQCGHCGRRLQSHRSGTRDTRYYRCVRSEDGAERECPGVSKTADPIEKHVYRAVADFAGSPAMSQLIGEEAEKLLRARRKDIAEELKRTDERIKELDQKLQQWADAFTDGKMSEQQFTSVSETWQSEYEELDAERKNMVHRLDYEEADHHAMQQVKLALEQFDRTLPHLPTPTQREILGDLLENLALRRDGDGLALDIKVKFLPEVTYTMQVHGSAPDSGIAALTDRELAVLKLLDDGLSYNEIDERFEARVANTTAAAARRKAGIRSNQELIAATRPLIEEALPRLPLEGRVHARRAGPILTALQEQHMQLRAQGLKYREIAEKLDRPMGSVGATMTVIRQKLRAATVDEAVEMWREMEAGAGRSESHSQVPDARREDGGVHNP